MASRSFASAVRNVQRIKDVVGDNMGAGLRLIGEEIMTDVKASRPGAGVPRDTGVLANSGRVVGPQDTANGPVVLLTFGGAAAPYALRQHEELDWKHVVGEARYLVRGADRWREDGSAALAAIRANNEAGLAAVGASQK